MKALARSVAAMLLSLVVAACDSESGDFRIEGRFLNLNQGEFYVFSPDGEGAPLDTIHVQSGRFEYRRGMNRKAMLLLVFPNYSDIPVFAEPGAKVRIEADATHLKEMSVTGTPENDRYTKFRLEIADMMPPEMPAKAKQFVRENPASPASPYIIRKHFMLAERPDYKTARQLLKLVAEADTMNIAAKQLAEQLPTTPLPAKNDKLPAFKATDIYGKEITQKSLNACANILYVWATWAPDTRNRMRQMERLRKDHADSLTITCLSMDASAGQVKRSVERDSLKWTFICDGKGFDSPLAKKLGVTDLPVALVVDRSGTVCAVCRTHDETQRAVKETLKKAATDKKPKAARKEK